MKKAFFKYVAIVSIALFSIITFAQQDFDASKVVVSTGSISELPQLLTSNVGQAARGLNVVIINFLPSDYVIAAVSTNIGTFEKQIGGRLFFQVFDPSESYPHNMVHVKLTNNTGRVFWEKDIFRHSTISIYSAAFPLPQPADNYVRLEQHNK